MDIKVGDILRNPRYKPDALYIVYKIYNISGETAVKLVYICEGIDCVVREHAWMPGIIFDDGNWYSVEI